MRAVYSTGFLFGEAQVLALAGLTVRRLRRWCRTGQHTVFHPCRGWGRVRLGIVPGGAPPEGHLAFALVQMMDDTEAAVRTLRARQTSQVGKISQSPAVCGNVPVFAGTRIPVGAVRRLHEDGYSVARILAEYPSLAEQDVTAVTGLPGKAA